MKRFALWLFKRMYREEIEAVTAQMRARLQYSCDDQKRMEAVVNSGFGMIDALEYLDLY